jgi:cobalt/nickel transport system permease protein
MLAIDRHAWTSRWQDRHPAEKLLLGGGLLLISITLPPLTTGPLVFVIMGLATIAGAGVPASAFLRVIAIPGAFLLTSAPFLAISLNFSNGIRLSFSPAGLETALQVVMRSLAAVSCLAFLTLTTPIIDLLPLLRRLGVPQVIVEIMLLIYRLVFVFVERATSGQQAQAARQGYSSLGRSIQSLGLLIAGLFQRSLERARRLETGLAARGFEGELSVLTPARTLSRPHLVGVGGVLLAVALAGILLDRVTP